MEEAVNEKSNPDEDKLVFEKEEAENYLTVEVVENQFNEEGISTFEPDASSILSEDLLVSDVTLNLSEIDYEEIGYQEAPMTLELSEEKISNYEIIVDAVGYVYVEETIYYISFNVKNNGKTKELKYVLDQDYLSETRTITEVLTHLGKLSEVTPTMGGFLDNTNDASIAGWKISEAANTWQTMLSVDFAFADDEEDLAYPIEKRTDYYLTAYLCKKASSNIYIDAIPAVTYDGRAHVALDDSYTATKNANLQLWVKYVADGEEPSNGMYLRYGKDYKVTYKNNKEVSVKINEQGEYVPLYTEGVDDAKRPCAIVTGIGNYKGFSATVYFDILPLNFSGYPMAEVSGLKNSYVLNSKGTITGGISPKVKLTHYYYTEKKNITKTYTLKLGKDYQQQLYLYEDGIWKLCEESNPSKITKEGKYLYTIKGIGNYTGMYFGQEYYDIFNDGTEGEINPQVSSYLGTDLVNCQFIVIGDASQDLANAKVSIRKSQLNYKRNTYYTGADFGITVTIGKGADKRVLTEGVDYYITFDGTDFEYVQGRYNDGVYSMGSSTEVYEGSEGSNARITIANRYKVTITALENNDNGIFGSKEAKGVRIKGIKIEPSWFKLSSPTLKYTGSNSTSLKYRNNIRMKVSVAKPANILSFDSNGLSNFQQKKETLSTYAVFVFNNAYNKNPGIYESSVIPAGPGVDHDSMISVKFKRTGISTREAFKKGILSISYDGADYNAGGSLPKNIVITLNGIDNPCGDMKYNGQTFWVNDYYPGMSGRSTIVQLKLTVSNNKKTGNSAALYVQGDGTVFKGKSGKFTYSVSPITVSDTEIPVLTSDTYAKDFGKITQTVEEDGFFAEYEPVAKPVSGQPKHKITLYQTYYKNKDDYSAGRRSLAKLSGSQYKLILIEEGSNSYHVAVDNSKAKIITGYDFRQVTIGENYTVFDKAATITGVKVKINGREYNYPTDTNLPISFTGGQIRFDKNPDEGVMEVILKDGTVLDSDHFYVEYGDNVGAGKGTFTVILKRNSEGEYKYGGKATFRFTIGNVGSVVL